MYSDYYIEKCQLYAYELHSFLFVKRFDLFNVHVLHSLNILNHFLITLAIHDFNVYIIYEWRRGNCKYTCNIHIHVLALTFETKRHGALFVCVMVTERTNSSWNNNTYRFVKMLDHRTIYRKVITALKNNLHWHSCVSHLFVLYTQIRHVNWWSRK